MDVNDITLFFLSVSNTVNVQLRQICTMPSSSGESGSGSEARAKVQFVCYDPIFSLCRKMQNNSIFLYLGYANRKVSETVNAESINLRARSKERFSTIWNVARMTFDIEMMLMTSQRRGSFMNSLQLSASEKDIIYFSLQRHVANIHNSPESELAFLCRLLTIIKTYRSKKAM